MNCQEDSSTSPRYAIASSDFELEPALQAYFENYPTSIYASYQIVLKVQCAQPDVPFSYIILLNIQRHLQPALPDVDLWDYLDAWCKLHKTRITISKESAFPGLSSDHKLDRMG